MAEIFAFPENSFPETIVPNGPPAITRQRDLCLNYQCYRSEVMQVESNQESISSSTPPLPAAEAAALLARLLARYPAAERLGQPAPAVQVRYRPFVNATAKISWQGGLLQVQMAEVLATAPLPVVEALFTILLSKLFRRRVPAAANQLYRDYLNGGPMRQAVAELRRARGRKLQSPPAGRHFHLEELFHSLNERFFGGALAAPQLGWSRKESRTLLGHFDPHHYSITISRFLDSPTIPPFVVAYVLYHEMLHIKHPVRTDGPRRQVHPPAFRAEEKLYPDYVAANKALKELCSKSCLSLF